MAQDNTPIPDINTTIAAAVNARVSAQVAEAMLNDETIVTFVTAALQQTIEVGDRYRPTKISFIDHLVQKTVAEKAKAVVAEEIEEAADTIKKEVRKALRASVGVIADSLVDGFVANASGRFPSIKVEFTGND